MARIETVLYPTDLSTESMVVAVRPVVSHGRAWKEIVSLATSVEADLVVMATRGHDSIGDDLLESTADRVLRYASCPVLLVG